MKSDLTVKKLNILFIPYLLISIGLCAVYTFLHWLLFIKLDLFSVKDIIVEFGGPIILSIVILLLFFRPRIRILDLKTTKGDLPGFYYFILLICLTVPNVIAQIYLSKATGKLTQLYNIDEIDKYPPTKYYKLAKFEIDKSNIGVSTTFEVGGRYNENFAINIYVVFPIVNEKKEDAPSKAFLGVNYSRNISNRLSKKEKEDNYNSLLSICQNEVEHNNFNEFDYLERVGNNEANDGYKEAISHCNRNNLSTAPILIARRGIFEDRLGNQSNWIFISFGISSIVWLIMVLAPKINQKGLINFENGIPVKRSDIIEFLWALRPQKKFYATPILIIINIGIFSIMMFKGLGFISFKPEDLLNWGANFGPLVKNGDWWRLVSNTFLHGGLIHLFSNVIGLVFLGSILEPQLGNFKFLCSYLLTGILASIVSILWNDPTVSVGASGSIFGLCGIFLALLITKFYDAQFTKAFLMGTLILIGYNLLLGLTGGIDNAAHIGGLVSGFILGLIFRLVLKKPVKRASKQKKEPQPKAPETTEITI